MNHHEELVESVRTALKDGEANYSTGRRSFLKSDTIEQKHIIDEIERVAIPHTDIHFIFVS